MRDLNAMFKDATKNRKQARFVDWPSRRDIRWNRREHGAILNVHIWTFINTYCRPNVDKEHYLVWCARTMCGRVHTSIWVIWIEKFEMLVCIMNFYYTLKHNMYTVRYLQSKLARKCTEYCLKCMRRRAITKTYSKVFSFQFSS